MGLLSNLRLFRWSPAPESALPVGVRPARSSELEVAIRLILRPAVGAAGDEQVREFMRMARQGSAAAGGVWVGERGGRMETAVLPLVSPGRTMLLFAPPFTGDGAFASLTRMAVEAACGRAAASGVHLAQSLVDPSEDQMHSVLRTCGFVSLADLIYLQANVRDGAIEPDLPAGLRWVCYSTDTHRLFGETILRIYSDSLDCPELNGLRDIDDIIAGHQATGEFDPGRWRLLCDSQGPVGLLLLAAMPNAATVEVVYLGLVPGARGRGLADVLMRTSLAIARQCGMERLSLAVDARNEPALRLYWRYGMESVCRRLAMMRDLRGLSTIHPQSDKEGG